MKKKVILILISILILLILSVCFKNHYYDSDDYRGEVIAIQVIDCKYDSRGELLKNLDESIFDEFLEELSKCKWRLTIFTPQPYYGVSFCIYYDDLSYEIISHNKTIVDGMLLVCVDGSFNNLLKKYYPEMGGNY